MTTKQIVTIPRTDDKIELQRWYANIARAINTLREDVDTLQTQVAALMEE